MTTVADLLLPIALGVSVSHCSRAIVSSAGNLSRGLLVAAIQGPRSLGQHDAIAAYKLVLTGTIARCMQHDSLYTTRGSDR